MATTFAYRFLQNERLTASQRVFTTFAKTKAAEEITKKTVDENHAKSIILAFLDDDSLKHTVQRQELPTSQFKAKVLEFINMMDSATKVEPLSKVTGQDAKDNSTPVDDGSGYWPPEQSWPEGGADDPEKLLAIRRGNCKLFGGWGHNGDECTTARLKVDGKGGKGGKCSKGNGGGKGKGRG